VNEVNINLVWHAPLRNVSLSLWALPQIWVVLEFLRWNEPLWSLPLVQTVKVIVVGTILSSVLLFILHRSITAFFYFFSILSLAVHLWYFFFAVAQHNPSLVVCSLVSALGTVSLVVYLSSLRTRAYFREARSDGAGFVFGPRLLTAVIHPRSERSSVKVVYIDDYGMRGTFETDDHTFRFPREGSVHLQWKDKQATIGFQLVSICTLTGVTEFGLAFHASGLDHSKDFFGFMAGLHEAGVAA